MPLHLVPGASTSDASPPPSVRASLEPARDASWTMTTAAEGADHRDPGQGAASQARKKVRLACQRCRDRRIKCDGQVPSCSKCAKAGLPCIDVDARQAGNALPRAYLAEAQTRLQWLEDLVRERLPDIDLAAGPRRPEDSHAAESGLPRTGIDHGSETPSHPAQNVSSGTKRPADASSSSASGPVLKSARRMAMDLGLFSLHPSASQAHYLGTSSGSLFAGLLRQHSSMSSNQRMNHHDGDEASDSDTESSEEAGEEKGDSRASSQEIIRRVQELLPPRHECDRLIKHFFGHYHAEYPLLHQPSFKSLVDALYASAEVHPPGPLQYNGWPQDIAVFRYNDEVALVAGREAIVISIAAAATHLFFVLSIASHLQTRKRSYKRDPDRFTNQAMSFFQLSLGEVSPWSVQSMLLCVLQEFLKSEGGSMWIVLHVAMSFAIELGLHRCHPVSARSSALAVHMRRRIFFTLYSLERYISTAQGRPIGFQDDTLDLTLPSTIQAPAENDTAQADQLFIPYSLAHFQWAAIISHIKYLLYRFQATSFSAGELLPLQQTIQSRLDDWLAQSFRAIDGLPTSSHTRLRTKARVDYNFAVGLLYQPSQACPAPDPASLRRCFDSAQQRLQLYDALHTQQYLLLSWPSTHGIFLAGAILIYCLWSSAEIRDSVAIPDVAKTMRLCSSLLTLGGEWWPLAQRGRRSFEKLADSTLQLLLNPQSTGAQTQPLPGQPMMGALPMVGDDFSNSVPGPETLDVEAMLQSFLQNDCQFADMLDTLDYPSVESCEF